MLHKLSRKQLGERAEHFPYSVYAKAMLEVFALEENVGKVGFHSDVYFVRSSLEKKFDILYPLPYVEQLMKEMGWVEGRLNRRR